MCVYTVDGRTFQAADVVPDELLVTLDLDILKSSSYLYSIMFGADEKTAINSFMEEARNIMTPAPKLLDHYDFKRLVIHYTVLDKNKTINLTGILARWHRPFQIDS
jgi:hypothetical protein